MLLSAKDVPLRAKIKIMSNDLISQIFLFSIPGVVAGAVAYYFFYAHLKNEENRRRFILHRENQKQSLPLKLQAYERMALFLERVNPSKLLIRVAPISQDKNDYENLIIHHIEQEFEHNLTQQIYVSTECWNVITTAKNTLIQNIRKATMSDKVDNAQKLRETILADLFDKESPTQTALNFLKNEVTDILG